MGKKKKAPDLDIPDIDKQDTDEPAVWVRGGLEGCLCRYLGEVREEKAGSMVFDWQMNTLVSQNHCLN